jgi:hypothetical protein
MYFGMGSRLRGRRGARSRCSRFHQNDRCYEVASLHLPSLSSDHDFMITMVTPYCVGCNSWLGVHNTRKVIPFMSDVQTDQYFLSFFSICNWRSSLNVPFAMNTRPIQVIEGSNILIMYMRSHWTQRYLVLRLYSVDVLWHGFPLTRTPQC